MLSGFGQSNGDGLFSTLHFSSRASAFQLAALKFVHRSSNIFLRLAAIFASHDSFFLSSDVPSEIAAFLAIQGTGFPLDISNPKSQLLMGANQMPETQQRGGK